MEERLNEDKRLNYTQKQAETFGRTNGADWRTVHPGCALLTFDGRGARQGKLDLTWLQVLQKSHFYGIRNFTEVAAI
ncbi:hypothetical protein PoB_001299100 [Plakobranchus ocellatus]|uniref:Uncharacterized protein n=1 Tax=Plakobranchus ocellatus TaxID=259542 RepID=A0AAV3YVS3_9GAST|nr:hypothetical protein PoB_001299100 [Plakobranchus ocellatus]